MPSAGRDFCGQCKRRVHNLDGMSDAQRMAFFATCSGEVCVSYTVRRSGALAGMLGLGVAAAALAGSASAASDTADVQTASTVQPVITGPTCDPNAKNQALEMIVAGGTTRAESVQWADESEVAETARPLIGEVGTAEWLPTPPDTK
jgi:hypothetical protein